jgi:A/G-specific adenine glycosylase
MPWRETSDPYRILVSEFMLQQTQVSRVVAKYAAFVNRFPDVRALAAASLQEVLTLWQGLGYNRRGKNLREAARTVVERFDGHLPDDAELLKTLPGVGKYTASAVAAFAFERPIVVLETNIRRVFLHHFFPRCESVHDRLIEPLVEATMPRGSVREWYYALMDYGARLGRILPNANRRSAHYTRQSAFHGSVREVRGRVIRALTREGTLTLGALERAVGPADSRLEQALESLEREGLIVLEGRRARLR